MRKGKKRPGFTFKNTKGIEYEVLFYKPNKKVYDGAVGICDDPKEKDPKILINPYLSDRSELNTAIHEFAHAFFWDKSEKDVMSFANAIVDSYTMNVIGESIALRKQPKSPKRNERYD